MRTWSQGIITWSEGLYECTVTKSVRNADGTSLNPDVFSYSSATDNLTFASSNPAYEGDYTLVYKVESSLRPTIFYAEKDPFTV